MDDFIDTFVEETEGMRSPLQFRTWAAITCVAGALERRVWMETDSGQLYPNLYTILAGSPASGKSLMVNEVRKLWTETVGDVNQRMFVGPDNPTKASFLDCLQKSSRMPIKLMTDGKMVMFCAMSVACREFGVMFAKNDVSFLSDLTDLYDNPPIYIAPRRSVESFRIDKPTINLIAGVTPDYLNDLLPDSAWGQGFTSRLLFIYGVKLDVTKRNVFVRRKEINKAVLVKALSGYFNDLNGEFLWEDDAQTMLNDSIAEGIPPIPDHGRLVHYISRRDLHMMKLSMISAVSAGHNLTVHLSDALRAKDWLLTAEKYMPDVFRAMVQKSDNQILEDLHHHIWQIWATTGDRNNRKPVGQEIIHKYLSARVPSERIRYIIEAAENTGLMKQGKYPGEWEPIPK
jgi:hypothetical protein